MRILITGACGFVGSHLAFHLRRTLPDAEVAALDNLSRPGSHITLPRLRAAGIRVRHADVRCASDFESLGQHDWVIDAAANPSVAAGVDGRMSSRQVIEHNLLGTVNILEFCKKHHAGLVLLSTNRVYSVAALETIPLAEQDEAFAPAEGDWPPGASPAGIRESFSTVAPVSLYGATKLASETLALEYHDAFDFPVIVDRCGVIAGPGQFGTPEQGIFSFWIGSWASRRPLRYLGFGGSGHQVRDALHPDDLAALIETQVRAGASASGIWNVGGGRHNSMSLAQLSRWCADRFGPHEVAGDTKGRKWDVRWLVMNGESVSAAYGWRPVIPLGRILDQIADHYVGHPEWLDLSQPYD
jgi:CDP-paratose 2-epimerase